MEHNANNVEPAEMMAALKEENSRLKLELCVMNRELSQRDRIIAAIENNYNIKINMFRSLAVENEKRQRFLKHMMKSSANFLILLDSAHNVTYCSDLFLQKIGVRYFSEIEGKSIHEVYAMLAYEELLRVLIEGLTKAVVRNKTYRHDVVADIEKNGEYRAYRITNTPMVDEELSGVIIDWVDTTDLINAKNEAEAANRSKSNFLATMSHEIRTPMNAIIGIAQIELQKDGLPEEYAAALEKIYSSGNNLLGIINDILDLSKIETGKLELNPAEYDTPNFINDAVQINIVRIGSKDVSFTVEADKNLPAKLFGDELRLKQILNNLLSNAIKYTHKGFVKLSVSHAVQGEDVLLKFSVEDSGQGLTPEDRAKLFSEYARFNVAANRTTEGTGLGLSITKRLVEMMGGKIEVESVYGAGSTFTVEVIQKSVRCEAIGEEVSEKLKKFSLVTNKGDRRKRVREIMPYGKVLIVDDVEINLYVAKGMLAPWQLNIETALSGFDAIDLIKAGNVYDIIFMDHMMPGIDGIETTRRLRFNGYEGAIIALTANAITGNEEMFHRNGFDGFISKPIDVRRLDAAFNRFIRDKHPEEAKKYSGANARAGNAGQAPPTVAVDPKMLEIFRRDAVKAVTVLRETVGNGDIKRFVTTAHAMKSALANVGENEKSQMALDLEKAGFGGDMNYINANTEIFINALEELVNSIPHPAESASGDGADVTEDTAYLAEQLEIVKSACEDYDDTKIYEALDRLKEKLWKRETAEILENIRELIFLHSDFDEAAERVRKLKFLGHTSR